MHAHTQTLAVLCPVGVGGVGTFTFPFLAYVLYFNKKTPSFMHFSFLFLDLTKHFTGNNNPLSSM